MRLISRIITALLLVISFSNESIANTKNDIIDRISQIIVETKEYKEIINSIIEDESSDFELAMSSVDDENFEKLFSEIAPKAIDRLLRVLIEDFMGDFINKINKKDKEALLIFLESSTVPNMINIAVTMIESGDTKDFPKQDVIFKYAMISLGKEINETFTEEEVQNLSKNIKRAAYFEELDSVSLNKVMNNIFNKKEIKELGIAYDIIMMLIVEQSEFIK